MNRQRYYRLGVRRHPLLTLTLLGLLLVSTTLSTASADDSVKIKNLSTLPPRALVVVDKNCEDLVQPYKLTDNFASLLAFSAEEGLKTLTGKLSSLMGGSANAASDGKLSASTKLAAKRLNWLPMSAELMYAERQHAELTNVLARDSKQGRKYYPVADKILTDVLASVHEPYDYRFKLFILKTSERNAIALPGGYLYIDQGLLESPELQLKAYFATAHEIAHVLQRHETQEMQSTVVDSFSVKQQLIDTMKSAKGNPKAVVDRIKLEKGQFTKHHVDQELQADSCAVKILSGVYDRTRLQAAINTFIKDLPKASAVPAAAKPANESEALIISVHDVVNSPALRHPNTQERTANLQAIYREIGP